MSKPRTLLACVVLAAAADAADKRPITETDLFRFVWVADPQISPDGKRVAFVRVTVNEKKDGYDTAIWIVAADGGDAARRVHERAHGHDPPAGRPTATRLAFIRARARRTASRSRPALPDLPRQGGEARALTDLPQGRGRSRVVARRRDASRSPARPPTRTSPRRTRRPERRRRTTSARATCASSRAPSTASTARATSIPTRPAHVWTVAVAGGRQPVHAAAGSRRGAFDEGNPAWSPDGKRLYFTRTARREPYYDAPDSDLFSVAAEGGEVAAGGRHRRADRRLRALARRAAHRLRRHRLNGKPVRSYDQPDLFVGGRRPAPRRGT